MDRRKFLVSCASALAYGTSSALAQPAPPQRLRQSKDVLTPSDFKYLGFYEVNLGAEFSIGQGLTHRYVGGQLRFLALGHSPRTRAPRPAPPPSPPRSAP